MSEYSIPLASIEHRYEIKKSQFICRVSRADDRAEAMAALAQAKVDYPDARHHCWAYLIGDPRQPVTAACNDDGEPSGTAGKPILNVLNHKDFGHVMVVVIRYFGGIKLGAGGLVRAYSTATQQAMELLQAELFVSKVVVTLQCEYAQEPELRRYFESMAADIVKTEYQQLLTLDVAFPEQKMGEFKHWLASRSGVFMHDSEL